jgi:Tol biopolymer transport system component
MRHNSLVRPLARYFRRTLWRSGLILGAMIVALAVAAALVVTMRVSDGTHAAYPGTNGLIIFHTDRDGDNEIYSMNADGSNPTNLTNTSNSNDQDPAWSADGTKIVFDSTRDTWPLSGGNEVYTMDADGSNQTRRTVDSSRFDGRAVWSLDGSQIAFATNRDGTGSPRPSEVYVMNADGTGQTNMTNDAADDHFPAWSPDGSLIAFQTDRDLNVEIYTMSATNGSGLTNLSESAGRDSLPAWSPDGTRIAFRSDRDGNGEIYVMNADGSSQTRLTFEPGRDGEPAWSPDGTKIAFLSDRDGDFEIYVMNADGTCPNNLTQNDAAEEHPDWQPLAGSDVSPPLVCPTPTPTHTPTPTPTDTATPTDTPTPTPTDTPTPTSTLTPTPTDPIPPKFDALLTKIDGLSDPPGIRISLTSKVNAAQKLFERTNPCASENVMKAFINQVKAALPRRVPPELAGAFILQAETIISQFDGGACPPDPDTDSDFVPDSAEITLETDPNNPDSDGDTLVDGLELFEVGTDPLDPETNGTPDAEKDPDTDGCTTGQEIGDDETMGGLRNPVDFYDFYDVQGGGGGPKDKVIDLPNDILGVVFRYAPSGTEPAYDVNFDRGPSAGPNPWNMTAPETRARPAARVAAGRVAGQLGNTFAVAGRLRLV